MTTRYSTLELEREGTTMLLWLARPEKRNSFDSHLLKELARAFTEIDQDRSVRVLVLSGRGKSFCAGADLAWMREVVDYTLPENRRDSQAIADAFKALYSMKKPTIAAVNGAAIGGGMGFLGACDIAVASTVAVFSLSEVRLGLVPACISPFLLRRAPAGALRRYMLSGERFDAAAALQLGLVDEVVSPEGLIPRAKRIAASLAEAAPGAQAVVKELLERVPGQSLDAALEYAVEVIAKLRAGAEAQKGMHSFLEKKPCVWN
ncbi:MAG: enoyl-CoA hydratase-related protein [Elusimicrobia bacterium]|nr:enoyl-CoA hydratase-related protein [Elusimicrobiota bacterium]